MRRSRPCLATLHCALPGGEMADSSQGPTYESPHVEYDDEYDDPATQPDLEYEGGDSFEYVNEGDLPEDAMYDEEDEYDLEYDEEELSSSPSIPDENINFDLVYALHTFMATVDGQATVQKGDHLVLLDDSNSYWWLVRVMSSQEVGYIPAENIETPYERLARLNKHRNVEITTATEEDNDEPAADGVLVKSRALGDVNEQSGKVSALSRRELGSVQKQAQRTPPKKFGVLFGQSQYLEHSGNEATEDEYEYDGLDADDLIGSTEPEVRTQAPDATALAPPAEVETRDSSLLGLEGLLGSADDAASQERTRPASLLGMPGSEKTFHVVRVFAGDDMASDATFKTVLLTRTTTAQDLVKQAMQRFALRSEDADDFQIVLHHIDGDEKALDPTECPLELLDELASLVDDDTSTTMPSKHDSVTSLMSLLDTSQSRLMFDYSDDRYGKLFLMRRGPVFDRSVPEEAAADASTSMPMESQWRFTIQMALYHTDLPPGTYFDPESGEPMRGAPPYRAADLPRVQKRLLRFTKNATVAEVIEAGLSVFHITDAVVDGGDDVEARLWHGRPRTKYTLSARSIEGEQPLHPTSKVLAAFDTLPQLTPMEPDSKRKSLDAAIAPGSPGDLMHTDPLFILRLVPSEPMMAESVATASPQDTPRAWQPPVRESSPAMPTAAPVLPMVRPNSYHGVDVLLSDGQRLRSSRVLDSPRVRYSLVSPSNDSRDVSDVLQPVLENILLAHGQRPSPQADLLLLFTSQMASLPEASVQADLDLMMRHVATETCEPREPAAPSMAPALRRPAVSPRSSSARERVGGLHLPSQPLQRTSSVRSVSASETAEPRTISSLPHRIGDRVMSDSTVTTGTDRRGQERYNFHALYGIVDALVLETPSSGPDLTRPPSDLGSTESPQSSVVRASTVMAKMLEDTPAEKLQRDSNGLFALPWPTSDVHSVAVADARHQYAPLMAQISALEAALDEQLLRVLAYQVPSST